MQTPTLSPLEAQKSVDKGIIVGVIPLVFAATAWGAGKLTTAFLKRVAEILAEKNDETYCTTMAWLRARLAFSLLRSSHSLPQELTLKCLMQSG